MAQLLIELFSEEIPARMQLQAARDFERLFGAKLTASGLAAESLRAYVGPRRLALVVEGLPLETAAVSEEVKGPREGAPPQALEGFLRKVGLTQDQLVVENGVWLARIEKPGVKTADVLGDMLREVILNFLWPKSMRSGVSTFRWVRPLKRILFLFDGSVVPFELEGLTAGDVTEGHRFLGSGELLPVSDFFSYDKALADNFVILDHAARQDIILTEAKAVCAAAGCELIEDQGLLEEVAGLNEYPIPLLGNMDPAFLTLPPEVIKTSMRTHQKYFAVRDAAGKMAAHFVITANMKAVDGGEEIKRGNAKVLSARLSDGVFFWSEDNKPGNFDRWLEKLKGVTFHAKLGTMAQRVRRIDAMAQYIAPLIGTHAGVAGAAARYAKADLVSHMVMEFPELQGVMGGYYADADPDIKHEVADAIREHYKPQGPSDSLPTSKLSAAVALADKIDTLVGFFAIDEKPTGSKDPYALRRSALGILRIIREQGARLSVGDLVDTWFRVRGETPIVLRGVQLVRPEILDFFLDRLKVQLREEGVISNSEAGFSGPSFGYIQESNEPIAKAIQNNNGVELIDTSGSRYRLIPTGGYMKMPDTIGAVFALKDDLIVRTVNKIRALEDILVSRFGDDLLAVHKRAANILAAAKTTLPDEDPKALADAPAVETALLEQLKTAKIKVASAVKSENYFEALQTIAALRHSVDAFLDGVLVNADDAAIKTNRLLIVKGVIDLSAGIADLGKIA